jgi:hypothetical protein
MGVPELDLGANLHWIKRYENDLTAEERAALNRDIEMHALSEIAERSVEISQLPLKQQGGVNVLWEMDPRLTPRPGGHQRGSLELSLRLLTSCSSLADQTSL